MTHPMPLPRTEHDRFQLWCLIELAGSAEALLDAEHELQMTLGRRPTLYELVETLCERHQHAGGALADA